MRSPHIYSIVLSLLACLIPPYALRLCRAYGTRRVGWALFIVFTLLAAQQIVRAWLPMGPGLDVGLVIDLLNFLVPVLILTGMVHIEMLFKHRVRQEEEEQKLLVELELQVKERTVELDHANEELQREISLRKQGEEELRQSKERYRFLFDENPQPMWIYHLETFRFLAFNSAALRHYGFSGTEFREMSAKDLCLPSEAEAFAADAGATGNGGQRRKLWRHCRKDGTIIEVELTSLDLVYAGNPARLVLAHDVTAQRRLQQQLLQTQKMQVTTQLAGGVADRFTTLVTALEGDANCLVQRCPDSDATEHLKRIAATAGCAAGLTRQLLALVGRHPMQPKSLDLNELIEAQNGPIARMLGNKIELQKVFWADLPSIMADAALVEQVLHHLVLNARDAMPKGGTLTLSTAAARVDEAHARENEKARVGAFVCLMVSDTGCGMTPEVQARLFEPFFTTKTNGKANGLGLATVDGLLKQHGGWVEVSSRLNAGTQVAVFFPCAIVSTTPRKKFKDSGAAAPVAFSI